MESHRDAIPAGATPALCWSHYHKGRLPLVVPFGRMAPDGTGDAYTPDAIRYGALRGELAAELEPDPIPAGAMPLATIGSSGGGAYGGLGWCCTFGLVYGIGSGAERAWGAEETDPRDARALRLELARHRPELDRGPRCLGGCTLWACGRLEGHPGPCQPPRVDGELAPVPLELLELPTCELCATPDQVRAIAGDRCPACRRRLSLVGPRELLELGAIFLACGVLPTAPLWCW